MGKEYRILDLPDREVFSRPDETGFTLRTRFKGTREVLDRNHFERSVAPRRYGEGFMHKVASIAPEVWEQWVLEWRNSGHVGDPDQDFLRAKLNSPEYAYLRTRGGRF